GGGEGGGVVRPPRLAGARVARCVRPAVRDADHDVALRQPVAGVRQVGPAPATETVDEVAVQAALVMERLRAGDDLRRVEPELGELPGAPGPPRAWAAGRGG